MLVALDNRTAQRLALPDHEGEEEAARLRSDAKAGLLVCPTCREPLWLRAGEQRIAHFSHRSLADCPKTHASVPVLQASRLLYRFFQARIEQGKLTGPVELEPILPEFPSGSRVDVLLRRDTKPAVAIVFLETGLKATAREALRQAMQKGGFVFRPVFLSSALKRGGRADEFFVLNTTQRYLMHESRFGLEEDWSAWREALHFVDPIDERWTSLRGLRLEHEPQVYAAHSCRESPMSELLWSEASAEWTHPGERKMKLPPHREPERPSLPRETFRARPPFRRSSEVESAAAKEKPEWITAKLACTGCNVRTNQWQWADLKTGQCVCRECSVRSQFSPDPDVRYDRLRST